ncbi:MAG: hypothetical protein L0H31_14315, partial [Nocardioidaceae bacterium]|nr:hypothetical protein [Nocardioidaceae bacterium]
WPGVVGILATAVLVVVGINDDEKWVVYLIGAIIAVLALVGYLMAKRGAFVVVGILGLALIYATLVEDILGDTMDGDNGLVVSSAALGAFVVGVTVLGWLLPSRALTGVVVGVVGVVGYAGILAGLLVARFLSGMFAFAGPDFGGADGQALGGDPGFRESDVWWVLVFAAVLTVLWALAASITNNPGFTVLAIAMPVLVVPLATAVLAAEKPSLWAAILAAGGGILLIGGVGITHLRGKKVARVQQSPQ